MAEEIIDQGYRELADTILDHNPGVDLGRVRAAFELADRAHCGQKRKAGTPYVTHCGAAAQICAEMGLDEDSIVAALLHDVIEDHGDRYSFDDLVRAGFPDSVIHALRLLTHESGVLYMDNVKALAKDPIARKVKLADLRHNSDPRRLNGMRAGKYELYLQAIRYLDAENRRTPE